MRRAWLLALLFSSCKDDPPQPAFCLGPDFDVLITTGEGPIPADTIVTMEYAGGDPEQYPYPESDPDGPSALFCAPSDREGNPLPATGGSGGEASAGLSGRDGLGGAGGEGPTGDVEAWRCTLWTDGPATLTVETSFYPSVEVSLAAKRGKCTVEDEIVIGPLDGGT